MRKLTTLILLLPVVALLANCGGGPSDQGMSEPAAKPDTGAATMADGADEAPAAAATLPRQQAPADARVFFITPADGDTVTSPVTIEFGIEGMSVAPAGVDEPDSGHHHLIVDAPMPDLSMPVPATENYIHFGDGSTSTTLELEPGEHTLQLLLGDYLHIPHDPPVSSDPITITVE